MKQIHIGAIIRQRRIEMGLTQEDLCSGICEAATLSRIEGGKQTPSRSKLNALLQRLSLPDEKYFAMMSEHEMEIEQLKNEIVSFNSRKLYAEALQQQLLRYKEDRTHSPKVEVAKYIGQLYKNRHLKIAESVDVFDCNRHDGVIHNNHLCLRGKALEKIYPNLNKEEIIQFLLNENALKPGKDKRTVQISKLKGLRFYAVKLESII